MNPILAIALDAVALCLGAVVLHDAISKHRAFVAVVAAGAMMLCHICALNTVFSP